MEKDMRPYLEVNLPWEAGNDFFPPSTRRAFGLIGNELYQAVCERFLTSKAYSWYGDRNEVNKSHL